MTKNKNTPIKLIRITTVPMALDLLLTNQMSFMTAKGMDVKMISAPGERVKKVVDREKVEHIPIHMTRKMTPFQDLQSLFRLYRVFRKIKPDIVHSHTPKAGLLGMMAAKLAGVDHRIHTVAGLPIMKLTGIKKRIMAFTERLTYRSATQVWPNSFSLKQYIVDNLYQGDKLKVIGEGSTNGIDLNEYNEKNIDPKVIDELKSKLNYDEDKFYFISIGRVVKDKGIQELVDAFEEVQKEHKHIMLLIVGSWEPELDPIDKEYIQRIENNPSIITTGYTTQVKEHIFISHCLVHASHREGFPNVPLQAGAMKCPVVLSKIEGNIDVIPNNEFGFLFPMKDEVNLKIGMLDVLNNNSDALKKSDNLRKRIEDNFSRKKVQDLIYQEYETLF